MAYELPLLESPKGYQRATPRLSEALFEGERTAFGSIAALPSNVKAIEACLLFSWGMQALVAVVGPSGWGKTHLLNASAEHIRRRIGQRVPVNTARDWLETNARPDGSLPLILDDVQDVLSSPRACQQLRLVLERRVQGGRPTLLSFTSPKVTRAIRAFLPSQRTWHIRQISAPDNAERELVVRQIAATQNLMLSQRLVRLLAHKTDGTASTIAGALQTLRLVRDQWVEPCEVLQACGVLVPYLADKQGWDLRDHVAETVSAAVPTVGGKSRQELCVYLMVTKMGLSEKDVASYFHLEPGAVYQQANAQAARADSDESLSTCEQAILRSLEYI